MGLFDLFRKKKPEPVHQKPAAPVAAPAARTPSRVDFRREISAEEKELVAVVASAIAAGSYPDASFKIKDIQGIDTDKEMAAAIVSAIMADDRPDSTFRLVSITETNKE
jgi:phosphoribosylamine-glycine ligase